MEAALSPLATCHVACTEKGGSVFVQSPDSAGLRIPFSDFLERVFTSNNKETCEVTIQKDGSDPLWVHIEAIVASSGGQDELCYAIVNDITSRKTRES